MGKFKEIAEGWANRILKPEHVERVARTRLNICNTCHWNSKFHKTMRPDVHCTKCGCTIEAKVRSMESECPIAKWPKITKDEQKQKTIRDQEGSSS